MKNEIFGILATLLVLASPVMAYTNIWTNLQTTGGTTIYHDKSYVGGMDWSEGAETTDPCDWIYPPVPRTTGFIDETIFNDGSLSVQQYLESDSPWKLRERKEISASGYMEVFKDVVVWTEDKKIDPQSGKLVNPTQAWVHVESNVFPVGNKPTDWYVLMDEPPAAEGNSYPNQGVFERVWQTDDDISLTQKVGINEYPCNLVIPEPPEPLDPHNPCGFCW